MNILAVHEAEYINKMVFEYQIVPEILSSKGHKVFVIDFPVSWKKESFFDFGTLKTTYLYNIKRSDKAKGITLIRPGFIKLPIIDRISAFISYFFLIRKALKKHNIEAIILYSAPNNGWQTIFWAKRYNIPVYFRLLDVLHQLVPRKILKYPTYLFEKYIYKRVQGISAVTPRLANYAIEMGGKASSTSFVPTASDADLFYPQTKSPALMKNLKISKKDTVVLFSGYLYDFSGLDKVITAYHKNRKKYPNFKFLIVGNGLQKDLLENLIRKFHLEDKVVMTGFINYEELPSYINLADVCINPFAINKTTDIIFPSKIYQYLACGKPAIATKLRGVLDIYPENKRDHGIFYYNSNKPEELLNLISELKNKKIKIKNLSLQDVALIFERTLKRLVKHRRK